jgi:ABC-type branched-subunit amino acid transport system ATPase component
MSDGRDLLLLEVEELTVRFGGAIAVDDLSLAVPPRRITGLIGPNGAGKTTTFNACCGLLRPTRGAVRLAGRDLATVPPQHRAQLGLGRTFQRMELFGSLTVRENVALGREALLAGRVPWRHLFCSSAERHVIDAATDEALELCGIAGLAARPVVSLSTGQRRLVELARVVAGGFPLLLLDEPSSGLDVAETLEFGQILEKLVSDRGIGILLVEHDMSLVMSVCSHLYVIDFGRPIFAGSADEAQRSAVVRAAYLGEAE